MSIEIIGTIALILGVLGAILNALKFRVCFIVWIASNILCAMVHTNTGILSLLIKDGIFTMLCIVGWIQWGRKK